MNSQDEQETVEELSDKMNEILRMSREQVTFLSEMRQSVRDIHERIMAGGMPILRNDATQEGEPE